MKNVFSLCLSFLNFIKKITILQQEKNNTIVETLITIHQALPALHICEQCH